MLRCRTTTLLCVACYTPLAASNEPVPSLYAAFSAFANCADDEVRQLLETRIGAFAAKTEAEVRALPEHTARNEQEKVLALQRTLLPAGTAVRFDGLEHEEINGCPGVVIYCLRDGSFLCAVETRCGLQSHEAPLACRVHVVNLRPAAGCAVAVPSGCGLDQNNAYPVSEEDAPLPDSLDKETIGRLIVDSVMRSRRSERPLPAYLASAFKGDTSFPDLPYSALAAVLARMQQVACAALAAGDVGGAEQAVEQALDLERTSRPASAADEHEVLAGVRFLMARLLAVRSLAKTARHEDAAARADALAAQRLNVTATISNRKLEQATSRAQRGRQGPHAVTGLMAEESARLQRWFADELLPLKQADGRPSVEVKTEL